MSWAATVTPLPRRARDRDRPRQDPPKIYSWSGNPGTGKSHLAIAIGIRACMVHKRVLFRYVAELLDELVAATVDHTLGTRLDTLSRLDLLILDELGYLSVDPRRASLFFQLISRRYEHGSIILTGNKPFEEWGAVFGGDDVIAAAVIDRLIHHSHIIAISGPSFRAKEKRPPKRGDTQMSPSLRAIALRVVQGLFFLRRRARPNF